MNKQVMIPVSELEKLEEVRKELSDILEQSNIPFAFTSVQMGVLYRLANRRWAEVPEYPKVLWYAHYSDGEVVRGAQGHKTKEDCEATFTNNNWYADKICIL